MKKIFFYFLFYDYGSGGWFLACEDLGRMFDHSFVAFALFFFLKWRSARAHQLHSLCQDQSTVAQRAEMTVAECSLTSCVWARFWISSHTMPGQQHSQPNPTSSTVLAFELSQQAHAWTGRPIQYFQFLAAFVLECDIFASRSHEETAYRGGGYSHATIESHPLKSRFREKSNVNVFFLCVSPKGVTSSRDLVRIKVTNV